MSVPRWCKSSYSGTGGNNCVEVASLPPGRLALREGDDPTRVLITDRAAFAALLSTVKSGRLAGPPG